MTITYRTAGAWGAGKGSNLTAQEVDLNFYDLTVRVGFLEDNPPQAVSIASIEPYGTNQFIINLTDSSIQGPFDIPAAKFVFRGQWEPSTFYSENDVVTDNGVVYVVNVDHTSAASFDPGLTEGSPLVQVYGVMLAAPDLTFPTGGAAGDVLTKNTSTNFDFGWATPHYIPAGGSLGQAMVKTGGFDYQVGWGDLVSSFADLSDVVLTSPIELGQSLRFFNISGSTVITNLEDIACMGWVDIPIADVLAHQTHYFVAPCDGSVDGVDAAVMTAADTTQHNVTYSTTGANAFNFATLFVPDLGNATVNAGWLALGRPAAGFGILDTEYKITAGAQTNVTDNVKSAATTAVDWIANVDALTSTGVPAFVSKATATTTNSASIACGTGLTGLINDVIVVVLGFFYSLPQSPDINVSGLINSGTLFSWARRSSRYMLSNEYANTKFRYEVWWAPATTAFTNLVVTANLSAVPAATIYGMMTAFAVRNLNVPTSPWDSNILMPAYQSSDLLDGTIQVQHNGSNVPGAAVTVTHTSLAGTRFSADASPRAGFSKGDQLSLVLSGFGAQQRMKAGIRYVEHMQLF